MCSKGHVAGNLCLVWVCQLSSRSSAEFFEIIDAPLHELAGESSQALTNIDGIIAKSQAGRPLGFLTMFGFAQMWAYVGQVLPCCLGVSPLYSSPPPTRTEKRKKRRTIL